MGLRNWGAKKAKGLGESAKQMLAVEESKKNWNFIKAAAQSLNPKRIKAGREETFEAARERLHVEDEDLEKVYTNQVLKFWVVCILLAGGIVATLLGQSWIGILPLIGFAALCLAILFNSSFRALQIKERKLFDVSYWAAHPEEWIPTSFSLPPAPVPPMKKKTLNAKADKGSK